MNGNTKWILSTLLVLILGAYAFTYKSGGDIESRIVRRLERIENKLDSLLSK